MDRRFGRILLAIWIVILCNSLFKHVHCTLTSLLFISDNLYAEQSFSFLCGVVCSKYSLIYIKIKENYLIAITMIIIGCMALILKQTEFIRNAQ